MNQYPVWKYVLLILIVGFGGIYALPNAYKPDPAVQILGTSRDARLDESLLKSVTDAFTAGGIPFSKAEIAADGSALVRLHDFSEQLAAQKLAQDLLAGEPYRSANRRFVVALTQASNTPEWLSKLGAKPMNLGLDLAGGVHFLLEVDTPSALNDRLADMQENIKKGIHEQRMFNVEVKREGNAFRVNSPKEEYQQALVEYIQKNLPDLTRKTGQENGNYWITAEISETTIREIENHAVDQNLITIRNRVNELGVSEPLVSKQGRNRIVVELPGVQDAAGAKKILGKTANLEFRMEASSDTPSTQREKFEFYDEQERRLRGPRYLERKRIITGENVVNATAGFDQESNSPKIDITLDSAGGTLMNHATRNDVGRNLGVLFIDYYTEIEKVVQDGQVIEKEVAKIDRKIISLATVRSALGVRFQTTGLGSPQEASDLALLLRAGSLAAPMKFVEERTIGPSLGADNIEKGITSAYIGLVVVGLLMLIVYKVFGLFANIALVANMLLLLAVMSILGATLTLPGIAGIVLTIGMAVDANVLIFSRIQEELREGMAPQSAIHAGFERAYTTILDSNLSNLIIAFILFVIGTGPVKGFAITLSLGILTSMVTAIFGSRAIINLVYGGRKVTKLSI